MTERFTLTNSKNAFQEMKCGINDRDKTVTFNEVVDLLNDLSDENEQLKQQIRDLYKFVKCDVDNEIDVYPKSILGHLVNILKIIGDVE